MTSKVIWIAIFTGLIDIIQHHKPISHCPCRRRSIGPLPSCFIIDIDFDILSFHLAFHCSEYNGYHIFVWIYGVSHGGYVYALKMYIFEKVGCESHRNVN